MASEYAFASVSSFFTIPIFQERHRLESRRRRIRFAHKTAAAKMNSGSSFFNDRGIADGPLNEHRYGFVVESLGIGVTIFPL